MIIVACLVLNNMALMFGDPEFVEPGDPDDDDSLDDLAPEVLDPSEATGRAAGEAHREELLRHFQA